MVKVVIVLVFLFSYIIDVSAQFNTIYRKNVQIAKEDVEQGEAKEVTRKDEEGKGFFKKGLFLKINGLFRNKKDSIPTDPNLFSYDKPEGNPLFIFTEQQEKDYLDSLKMVLIKKRREVLAKRSMMSLPMDTLQITSYFGYRTDPFTGEKKFHNGIDFRARNNFIYPILPGVVIRTGFRGGYGYCIEVKHGELTTLYAHLSYILVQEQQVVPAGEPIGISGTTGRSTGEHLHFSVTQNGKFINPSIILEYILGELADRNMAVSQGKTDRVELGLELGKEKEVLEDLRATESEIEERPKSTVVFGGKKGKRSANELPAREEKLSPHSTNVIERGKRGTVINNGKGVSQDGRTKYEKVENVGGGIRIRVVSDMQEVTKLDSVETKAGANESRSKKEVVRSSTGTRIIIRKDDVK